MTEVLFCLCIALNGPGTQSRLPGRESGYVSVCSDCNSSARPRAPYAAFCTLDDPPESVWTIRVPGTFGVGVTDVQDSLMWVTAGQTQLKFYVYKISDPSRPLIDSFPQTGGPSGWGIRDMAYNEANDGVFAGFDGQRFHVLDATWRVVRNTYTISGYSGTVRGFAYSPIEDSCWTCNFTTSPMAKFSVTGLNGHQVRAAASMASAYGLAFDTVQHCFWVTQAGASGASPIWKMTYPGYQVVDSFNPSGWDMGGGCEMWRDTYLLALEQGTPDDLVWCFRFQLGPRPAHDIGVSRILTPRSVVNPCTVTPKAVVRNTGASPESNIPVTCWIDSSGTRVYNQSATLAGPLAPGASDSIAMPTPWSSGPPDSRYTVTFFTSLAGDTIRHNDTMRQTTLVTDAVFSDTIIVRRVTGEPPTIDGLIHTDEWAPAIHYDISDTAGRAGQRQEPSTNLMYYLYDDSFVYYACDCPGEASRADYDQFGVYMDENNDGLWAPDSSEGRHLIAWIGGDTVIFGPMLLMTPQPQRCPGARSVSGLESGHLQFEAKIPIGARRSDYTIAPGDTVRMFQGTALAPGNRYIGWWPQSLLMSQWPNPQYYGPMIFDTSVVGLSAGRTPALPRVSAFPSPARDRVRFVLSDFSLHSPPFSILFYSSSGRLVRSLSSVSCLLSPVSSLVWDCRDADGAPVPAGTYFYRISTTTVPKSGKVIVKR